MSKVMKRNDELAEELKRLRDLAPSLSELPGEAYQLHKLNRSKVAEAVTSVDEDDAGYVSPTPGMRLRNIWEVLDYALRRYQKVATNWDRYGIPLENPDHQFKKAKRPVSWRMKPVKR